MSKRYYPGAGPYRGRYVSYTGYDHSKSGTAACAVGPEIRHAVSDVVERAIGYAQLIAPNDSTEYQRSFDTDVVIVPDISFRVRGEPMARWSGRVVNHSEHAILVEVGGKATPDYRVMRRTLEWIELVADE